MGLDICTYTKAQQDEQDVHDSLYGDESGFDWETATEEQKKLAMQYVSYTDVPSAEFPDNINNRRYLRSSYNSGGFNSFVPEVTGRPDFTYDGVFERLLKVSDSDYKIKVTNLGLLADAREKASAIVDALSALSENPVHRVLTQRAVILRRDLVTGDSPDDDWALATWRTESDKWSDSENKSSFGSYSNWAGTFFHDEPLKVVAVIAGEQHGRPAVHVVYETQLHSSYLESAKVLVEFIDELAELVTRDGVAYVHWSG